MFTTQRLLPGLALFFAAAVPSAALAQTVGVDFSSDYADRKRASPLDDGAQLPVDTGAFNGGAALANAGMPGLGGTSVLHAGMQITSYRESQRAQASDDNNSTDH
ncbi:MAG: hypothetical protein AAF288_06005 [Planctomycetota bacterium]